MTMNSYERVRRAIEFETPDRLPVVFQHPMETNAGDWIESDVAHVNWNFIGTGDRKQVQTYDEWGCLWVRLDIQNMGQIKRHPLDSWEALNDFQWPDPDNPDFYVGIEDKLAADQGKYICTDIFMLLFERMQALRGYENCLTDFHLFPDKAEMLSDRLVDFDLGIIRNLAQCFPKRIHGMWFTDDWGTQQGLMIHPHMWRKFFKPRYKVLFDAMHAAGWHIWMHTDGRMNEILEDLLELGLDVVNFQQPRVNGIEEIGEQFRGRLCFESSVDIQSTLPTKSPEEVRSEAIMIVENWACPQGGFILSIDESEIDLNFPHENTLAMIDAFMEADPWGKQHREDSSIFERDQPLKGGRGSIWP